MPNGEVIANRITKAAMEENMTDIHQAPSRELKQLYKAWADVARAKGVHFWVQLSHPGRMTMANLGQQALAPSAIALELNSFSKMLAKPRAMSADDIQDVIKRFTTSARRPKSRVHRGANPRRPRLPVEPVSLALEQPSHRPLGRFTGESCGAPGNTARP